MHYITNFRYPTAGGFNSYLRDLPNIADIKLEHELVAIDPKRKTLTFSNGFTRSYDALVSSVALTELIPMIAGAPADVVAASQRLACSTCVLVNVGVDRADFRVTDDLLLRRGHLLLAYQLSPHAVGHQCTAGLRKHSSGGLLFQ